MHILKPFLILFFLTVVAFSLSIKSNAQQPQDLRIKNQAGVVKKKSKHAIKRKDHKTGSSIGNQKIQNQPKGNPTADFRGEPPVSLPGNPDKLQRDMSAYKGTIPLKGQGNDAQQLQMSKYLGNKIFSREYKRSLAELQNLKMSQYLGNKILTRDYKKSLQEIKNLKMSQYLGTNKIFTRQYKMGLMEIKNYHMSKFIGNKILTREYKMSLQEIKNYHMSKFIGNKIYTREYRRSIAEIKNYHMSKFIGNKIYTREYKRSLMEIKNFKMSNFKGERLKIKKLKNAYPNIVYQKSRLKRSFAHKEKFRKRVLKRLNKQKYKQVPPSMRITKKSKAAAPTYDSRESEIWVKPRNEDGTEMAEQPVKSSFFKNLFRKKNKGPAINKSQPMQRETKPVKETAPLVEPEKK